MLTGCTPWPPEFAARYRRAGLWRGDRLGDLPAAWASRSGDATALIAGETTLSYRELSARVDRMAAGFRQAGIRPGDRVILQLPNVPEFVIAAFALFRAAAKPVFSLASHRASEIRHVAELSGAAGYVAPARYQGFDYRPLARQVLREVTSLRQVFLLDDLPDADPAGHPPAAPADVAFFLQSGGTTALPKLIPRTHDDYAYQVRAAAEACELTAADVYLAALPVEFNFTWGCPGVVGTLNCGGTVVLAPAPDPGTCLAAIERHGVTITSVVPTVAQLWLEAAAWMSPGTSSLRLMQIGGARLQPGLAARIEPAFGCRLQQVFGMAEGLLSVSRSGDSPWSVLHTQGRPLSPADEVRIVDGSDAEVPAGVSGELLARGPYTLRGYYQAPEHNRRAFTADGFYRTGDLARLTPGGHLVIEGRLKDVVIRGGDKVSAGEVEGHLLTHPQVAGAAVVPVPDEMLGERTCAFIIGKGDRPTLPALRRALHQRGLADYKLPDLVEFVDAFPLTPLGKVDKKVLAAAARDASLPRDWAGPEVAQDPK